MPIQMFFPVSCIYAVFLLKSLSEVLSVPFHIALIEPEIPQNTGNIARTCACTGASLHLVGPMGFTIDDRKLKRAGLDYWHELDITYYDSLGQFLERHAGDELFFFTTKGGRCYSDIRYPDGCYLVFGKETAGLPEALLRAEPQRCARIPMRTNLRSLNLSNSAAIAIYEALRQHGFPNLAEKGALAAERDGVDE